MIVLATKLLRLLIFYIHRETTDKHRSPPDPMKTNGLPLMLVAALAISLGVARAQTDINLTGYTQTFDEEFNTLSVTTSSPKGASTWYYWPPYGSAGAYSESTWDASSFSVSGGVLRDTAFQD